MQANGRRPVGQMVALKKLSLFFQKVITFGENSEKKLSLFFQKVITFGENSEKKLSLFFQNHQKSSWFLVKSYQFSLFSTQIQAILGQ